MEAPLVRSRIEALGVELGVDRVRSDLARMQVAPDRDQAVVVLAPAFRTRTMPGCERRHFVEEEELGVAAGLQQWTSAPAAELEPARDPALHREAASDAALAIVKTAAIAVHEATGRVRDQIAERRDAVLERHLRRASAQT